VSEEPHHRAAFLKSCNFFIDIAKMKIEIYIYYVEQYLSIRYTLCFVDLDHLLTIVQILCNQKTIYNCSTKLISCWAKKWQLVSFSLVESVIKLFGI
jgi:hypothetical protein